MVNTSWIVVRVLTTLCAVDDRKLCSKASFFKCELIHTFSIYQSWHVKLSGHHPTINQGIMQTNDVTANEILLIINFIRQLEILCNDEI